jgi:hypothetical protein
MTFCYATLSSIYSINRPNEKGTRATERLLTIASMLGRSMKQIIACLAVGLFLTACSEGSHPIECSVGFTWGDCVPGTPGYRAPPPSESWSRTDGAAYSPIELARSRFACMKDAYGNADAKMGDAMRASLFDTCMQAYGWTPRPPGTTSPSATTPPQNPYPSQNPAPQNPPHNFYSPQNVPET